jgi:hypothetical protein
LNFQAPASISQVSPSITLAFVIPVSRPRDGFSRSAFAARSKASFIFSISFIAEFLTGRSNCFKARVNHLRAANAALTWLIAVIAALEFSCGVILSF